LNVAQMHANVLSHLIFELCDNIHYNLSLKDLDKQNIYNNYKWTYNNQTQRMQDIY